MRVLALLVPLAAAAGTAAADAPRPAAGGEDQKATAGKATGKQADDGKQADGKPATADEPAAAAPKAAGRTARGPEPITAPPRPDPAAPAALCKRAIDLHAAGDLVRAGLLVRSCDGIEPLAAAARKARIAITRAARAGAWSPVELVVRSDAAVVTVDAFPDVTLAAGSWRLPPGTYRFTARTSGGAVASDLTIDHGDRAIVVLDPPPPAAPGQAATRVIDLGDGDGPIAAPIAGPPPKVEHESLLPARYRKGLRKPPPRKPSPRKPPPRKPPPHQR